MSETACRNSKKTTFLAITDNDPIFMFPVEKSHIGISLKKKKKKRVVLVGVSFILDNLNDTFTQKAPRPFCFNREVTVVDLNI